MRNKITRAQVTRASCAVAALTLLTLTGCDQIDPLTRPYVWHPTDINVHNIAAQVDNPADLIRGRETKSRRAMQESDAVDHLWAGKPAQFIGSGGGASSSGGAAAPAGGS
jgi:type IV pilus biogenesis protein CpaD/CtpE